MFDLTPGVNVWSLLFFPIPSKVGVVLSIIFPIYYAWSLSKQRFFIARQMPLSVIALLEKIFWHRLCLLKLN